MARGPLRALASARLAAHVAWIALRTYRNPLRAARALHRLRAEPRARRWPVSGPRRARLWTSQKCARASGRWFWDLYAPGWPSAAFDRCVERELERADPRGRPRGLDAAVVAVTRRCALRCEHCVESAALRRADVLSSQDLHEIVARIRRLGVTQLYLTGGEPLERFGDVLSLAASASGEADVWVVTSGRGLAADEARSLRAAAVTGVALSLDHWDAGEHDRFRGRTGSFAAAGDAARHARDAGLLVALWLCPTRDFVTDANLARYAETARSLGAAFVQILEPRPAGGCAGRDVDLSAEQQRLLEDFTERLNTDPGSREHPAVRYVDWEARACGCCGAGDRFVYVDTQGEIHACPFCREPGLRVLDHDIHDVLSKLRRAGCPAGTRDRRPHAETRR
jgi:MoaA/NifB/PqqE/SkfB family radical SAM enzyme